MRKPEIDYRTFRLSKLNDPQFAHLKLLGAHDMNTLRKLCNRMLWM